MAALSYATCVRRVAAIGLALRGGFHVRDDDAVPATAHGAHGRTLVLIGNTGSTFWPRFQAAPEYRDGRPQPLDRWSERVITGLARELGAQPLFPFTGPPFHPFQRWARRAETLHVSPLGTLIHHRYGVWHAYRGALVFDYRLGDLPDAAAAVSPCLSCVDQPCLNTCPVGAFRPAGFDVDACAAHLAGPNDCAGAGCQARNACPAGKPFRYRRDQHRFHLAAFRRARET